MKRVNIADLKNQLSRHLRAAEHGAEIEVTDRRRPIVRLVPVRASESQVRVIPARRPFAEVRDRRYPRARWGSIPSRSSSRNAGSGERLRRLLRGAADRAQ